MVTKKEGLRGRGSERKIMCQWNVYKSAIGMAACKVKEGFHGPWGVPSSSLDKPCTPVSAHYTVYNMHVHVYT